MAETVGRAFGNLAGLASDMPQPFSSLRMLVEAEEKDAKRIRPSRVGWWKDVRRVKGSTLSRVWKALFFFTLEATVVAIADLVYGRSLGLTNNVTPMLSVVVGLLLVFRNGSAYARWDDGRKTFAKMLSTTRNLSRTIWVNVGAPPPLKGRLASDGTLKPTEGEDGTTKKDRDDKEKALRLLVAFVVATKHHVRREYGTDWPDLAPVLPPKFKDLARTTGFGWGAAEADHHTPSSSHSPPPTPGLEPLSSEIRRLSSKHSTSSLLSAAEEGSAQAAGASSTTLHVPGSGEAGQPPLASPASFRSAAWPASEDERRPLLRRESRKLQPRRSATGLSTDSMVVLADYMAKPSLPLPLVIAHQLSLYFASCKRRSLLESIGPAGYNNLVNSLNGLVDSYTTCERLAGVGIPTVYGIHLKQCTTLFLLTLPLVLVELMGFAMIPLSAFSASLLRPGLYRDAAGVVTVVAFTLTGIEAIASEIEMPFGVDDSDLPLDLFCAELRNEVEHMISRLATAEEDWEM
ncbi:hypothetical protein JCM6882_004031 [Rhodosporidiobolus microsporus]